MSDRKKLTAYEVLVIDTSDERDCIALDIQTILAETEEQARMKAVVGLNADLEEVKILSRPF